MNAIHLYQHPDGGFIDFDLDTDSLVIYGDEGKPVSIPVGPVGLVELGEKLIRLGKSSEVEA